MKYVKNICSHYRKIFAFGLLVMNNHIQATDVDLTTKGKSIVISESLDKDLKYNLNIKSAPSFLTLKKEDPDGYVLELNSKLFRYATKKDPLIVTIKDLKCTYRDKNGDYQETMLSDSLKIQIAAKTPEYFNKASKTAMTEFMQVKKKKIGESPKKYRVTLAFFDTKRLSVFMDKEISIKKIASKSTTFEIGEIEVIFPKKESEQGNVGSLILKMTSATIFASVIGGGVSYAIIKKKKKNDNA